MLIVCVMCVCCVCVWGGAFVRIIVHQISETFDGFTLLNDTEKKVFLMKHKQRQLSNFTGEDKTYIIK